MSNIIENLTEAQKFAMSIRPKVGGFPPVSGKLSCKLNNQMGCGIG